MELLCNFGDCIGTVDFKEEILENGDVIHYRVCRKDPAHVEKFVAKAELYQPHKRIKVPVTKEDKIKEITELMQQAPTKGMKHYYRNLLETMKKSPFLPWEKTELVSKNCSPVLVHEHGEYRKHRVSQKHREEQSRK